MCLSSRRRRRYCRVSTTRLTRNRPRTGTTPRPITALGRRAQRITRIASRFGVADRGFHEIGCAFGGTVSEPAAMGFEASGSDLNGDAVRLGRERGAVLYHGAFCEAFFEPGRKPGVIDSYHMIERVLDPAAFLLTLRGALADDGIAIFITPNALTSFPLVHNFQNYPWYKYPEHLHLFSPASVQCVARSAGLALLHVTTARFEVIPEASHHAIEAIGDSPVAYASRLCAEQGDAAGGARVRTRPGRRPGRAAAPQRHPVSRCRL